MFTPTTVAELAEIILSSKQILAVGARTKPGLSQVDATLVSTRGLSGIVEYDPSEFTFTAQAGTPLREIIATLAARGQYLPFEPPLAEAGATVGGTVAAGLSGPGRFRYGGLRDFILAVRFLDGKGTHMRGGAKVVKNAAGFDIPKFFVGSLGRFGVLTEVTFKVFPCPPAQMTFAIRCEDAAEAVAHISKAASGRWEFDALDYDGARVLARIRGPQEALEPIAEDVLRHWPNAERVGNEVWRGINEFAFAKNSPFLVRVPMTLGQLPDFEKALRRIGAGIFISGGGGAAYVFFDDEVRVEKVLRELGLRGCYIFGLKSAARIGSVASFEVENSLRNAFDSDGKFPSFT